MGGWVLLRHDLPDGTWHHDWMLEPPAGTPGASAEPLLITFRLNPEVTWPPGGWFGAVRLPDHRRVYLTYEGRISGGRGAVRRVSRGPCEVEWNDGCLIVEMDGRRFRGSPEGKSDPGAAVPWTFVPVARPPPAPDLED